MYVCNQEDWFILESYSVGRLLSLVVIYSRMAKTIGKYSVSRLNLPSCDLILSFVQASKDCVRKTFKRLEEKIHGRVSKCISFLGGQIKIPVASFVERGVQTFVLLELHWF